MTSRSLTPARVKALAHACGFQLAGIAPALPLDDMAFYRIWRDAGYAGEMRYLTDRRGEVRADPRHLLPSARSIVCVGMVYHTPLPLSVELQDPELGWISRYAWGEDYHELMRARLATLAARLAQESPEPFESRVCVDTAPLLERSYAHQAGLGWIAKNTCLINEPLGSWFFLGELLVSLELEPDRPPADRCGTCTRCIDACPTQAIVPAPGPGPAWTIDSRLCISYFTIELRSTVPEQHRTGIGNHLFGCDVCQDVCPWNRRSPASAEPSFSPRHHAPRLDRLAELSAEEFRDLFRHSPVIRARYSGFLRNVAIAMGNSGLARYRAPLEKLAASEDPLVAEHARWAISQLQ